MKYGNRKTVYEGITFDSQKEARRYRELRLLQKAGQISELKLQVSYILIPAGNGERAVKYIADFTYVENGRQIVEDIKLVIIFLSVKCSSIYIAESMLYSERCDCLK